MDMSAASPPSAGPRGFWGSRASWMLLVGLGNLVGNGTPLSTWPHDNLFSALAYNVLQFGVPVVLLTQAADRLVDRGTLPAWAAYPVVVVATIVLGVWVIGPALAPFLGTVDWWSEKHNWSLAGTSFVWHALGMMVYVQLRFSRRAQARLKVLQAAAAERERKLAAAQLLALQARVDPALLSDRLAAIDAELVQAPPRAQARLAALIELLRALQPHVEAEVSTLAREIVALRAYARLVSADAQHTERLHLMGLAEPPAWPLAPMVLLPLVRPLLDEGASFWSLSLHTEEAAGPGRAELRLLALGPDPETARRAAARVPMAELARRLRAVHGERARLQLISHDTPLFILSWPIADPS